jgi:BirA family biotin operon repressor/biotin-[acetyl-CoA-carboxylase] ligase
VANPWSDLSRPPLRDAPLRRALTSGPTPPWRVLDVVDSTGSTNADLAERARRGEAEGAVLVADHQTAGRGRRDRSWTAPPRSGIAVSVLLRPGASSIPAERWSWLSLLAGVAVTDALIHTCGLAARLKWPNDVLVSMDGRPGGELGKVAGLLAEVIRSEAGGAGQAGAPGEIGQAVVLGMGINVSQSTEELPVPTATSLRLAGSATSDRDTVLRSVLRSLSDRYREWTAAGGDPRAGLAAVYRERCATIGRQVRVELPNGTTMDGLAEGVDDEGRLLVREYRAQTELTANSANTASEDDVTNGVLHALSAGDVVHIRPTEPA